MRYNRKRDIATFLISATLGWYFAFGVGFAEAQNDCRCRFSKPPWEAFAPNTACTIIMHPGKTTCEIDFGGLGADRKLISGVLGEDPASYRRRTFNVLSEYLQYLRDNKQDLLADPKFLSTALPQFMRGAYLRASMDDIEQVKKLDSAITDFIRKYPDEISQALQGKRELSTKVGDAQFEVGKGYISVDHPAGRLITRYVPGE